MTTSKQVVEPITLEEMRPTQRVRLSTGAEFIVHSTSAAHNGRRMVLTSVMLRRPEEGTSAEGVDAVQLRRAGVTFELVRPVLFKLPSLPGWYVTGEGGTQELWNVTAGHEVDGWRIDLHFASTSGRAFARHQVAEVAPDLDGVEFFAVDRSPDLGEVKRSAVAAVLDRLESRLSRTLSGRKRDAVLAVLADEKRANETLQAWGNIRDGAIRVVPAVGDPLLMYSHGSSTGVHAGRFL